MAEHRMDSVAPISYPGGKDGMTVGYCSCGYTTSPGTNSSAWKSLEQHIKAKEKTVRDKNWPTEKDIVKVIQKVIHTDKDGISIDGSDSGLLEGKLWCEGELEDGRTISFMVEVSGITTANRNPDGTWDIKTFPMNEEAKDG